MHGTYEHKVVEQRKIERTILQTNARLCSCFFGDAVRGIWKHKTAECLAAAIECSVRSAAYQISGEHAPSAKALAYLGYMMANNREPKK